jgi:hypothetical protein
MPRRSDGAPVRPHHRPQRPARRDPRGVHDDPAGRRIRTATPVADDVLYSLVSRLPRRLHSKQLWQLVEEPLRSRALRFAAGLEAAYLDAATVEALLELVRQGDAQLLERLLEVRGATRRPLNAEALEFAAKFYDAAAPDNRHGDWSFAVSAPVAPIAKCDASAEEVGRTLHMHDEKDGGGTVVALSSERAMARNLRRWLWKAGVRRPELHQGLTDPQAPHPARSPGDRRDVDGRSRGRPAENQAAVRARNLQHDRDLHSRGGGRPPGLRRALPCLAGGFDPVSCKHETQLTEGPFFQQIGRGGRDANPRVCSP